MFCRALPLKILKKTIESLFFYDVISKMAAIFGALKYMIFLNGKHTSVSNVLYHFWYQNNDPKSHTRVKGHFKVISKMGAIFGALKYILFLNGKHTSVSNVLYRFWG